MHTIAAAWNDYAQGVLPADAPPVQRSETRRAFYAGAWAMLMLATEVAPDAVGEAQGVDMLEAWTRELRRFQRAVQDGQA